MLTRIVHRNCPRTSAAGVASSATGSSFACISLSNTEHFCVPMSYATLLYFTLHANNQSMSSILKSATIVSCQSLVERYIQSSKGYPTVVSYCKCALSKTLQHTRHLILIILHVFTLPLVNLVIFVPESRIHRLYHACNLLREVGAYFTFQLICLVSRD